MSFNLFRRIFAHTQFLYGLTSDMSRKICITGVINQSYCRSPPQVPGRSPHKRSVFAFQFYKTIVSSKNKTKITEIPTKWSSSLEKEGHSCFLEIDFIYTNVSNIC